MKNVISAKYVVLRNFLAEETNRNLYNYATQNQSNFLSRTSHPDYPPQQGYGATEGFDGWRSLVEASVEKKLRFIFESLAIQNFQFTRLESNVSAILDGGYLGIHNDTFCANTRLLTFIYYFHSLPKKFAGGQLVIYNNQTDCFNQIEKADSCHFYEPENNSCIIFPAANYHQVLPVACSDFKFGRFSVNGWVHR